MRAAYIGLTVFITTMVAAQPIGQQECQVLIQRAMQAIGTHCAELGRNTVCYGNDEVRASFNTAMPDDFFIRPADTALLNTLTTVAATSLSVSEEVWGIAVMNVQANVPETLPGQAVTFILLGDSEIENAAPFHTESAPRPNLPVIPVVNSNIRSGPGTNFNRLDVAREGTELIADAISEDGQWLRVVFRNNVGWVFRDNLVAQDDFDSLTPPDEAYRGVMQAFFLRTGVGETTCSEAPEQALLIQGPKNFEVNLTVNGARVNIGSSVLFRTRTGIQNELEISVLDGYAEVIPDIEGAQPVLIREGYRSVFCLGDAGNHGADGQPNDHLIACNGTAPERLIREEVHTRLCQLQDIPGQLLRYNIDLPCPGDPVPVQAQPVQPSGVPADQSNSGGQSNGSGQFNGSGQSDGGGQPNSNADGGWVDPGNCGNPPPPHAPAHGWRARCEGSPHPSDNNGMGMGMGMGMGG